MHCTLASLVSDRGILTMSRSEIWDKGEQGHKVICPDCDIDYPNFRKQCLRCGKKLG